MRISIKWMKAFSVVIMKGMHNEWNAESIMCWLFSTTRPLMYKGLFTPSLRRECLHTRHFPWKSRQKQNWSRFPVSNSKETNLSILVGSPGKDGHVHTHSLTSTQLCHLCLVCWKQPIMWVGYRGCVRRGLKASYMYAIIISTPPLSNVIVMLDS